MERDMMFYTQGDTMYMCCIFCPPFKLDDIWPGG